MYIKINSAKQEPDKYGNKIVIDRVGIYDDSGKWIKWVKLNEALLKELLNAKINYNGDK